MNIQDIRTELETSVIIKKLDIVNLVIYGGPHYCTEIHYWSNLEALTVTLYSEQAYKNRIASKLCDMHLVKTIYHMAITEADIIEAKASAINPVCPF